VLCRIVPQVELYDDSLLRVRGRNCKASYTGIKLASAAAVLLLLCCYLQLNARCPALALSMRGRSAHFNLHHAVVVQAP
jgi:hypothetical protein